MARATHVKLGGAHSSTSAIAAGEFSSGVTARGKSGPEVKDHPGVRHGLNDYTGWFAGDADMGGDYCGYDGPCPPFNDLRLHRYHFIVYALGVNTLNLPKGFTGEQAEKAIAGHILAHGEVVATYTTNPQVRQIA